MARRLNIGIKNGIYAFLVGLSHLLLKVLFRLRICGREHLKTGEYIVVARHRSYWDIPILSAALGAWNRVHFIARRGLMENNLLVQPLIRAYSTIIDRENFGTSDFRKVLTAIKRERLVGIFPEGTTRERVEAKSGAVRFARLSHKDLLPVNIQPVGPYPPQYPFRFPRMTVSIGEPIAVATLEQGIPTGTTRSERYRAMSERLMERVDNV